MIKKEYIGNCPICENGKMLDKKHCMVAPTMMMDVLLAFLKQLQGKIFLKKTVRELLENKQTSVIRFKKNQFRTSR